MAETDDQEQRRIVITLPDSEHLHPDFTRNIQSLLPELQARLHQRVSSTMNHPHVSAEDLHHAVLLNAGGADAVRLPYTQPHSHGSQGNTADMTSQSTHSVINMAQGVGTQPQVNGAGPRVPNTPHGHTHNAQANRASAGIQQLGMQMAVKWIQGGLPFLILLLAKVFYEHRLGILVFAGLFGTFYYANNSLKKHIAWETFRYQVDQPRPSALTPLWLIAFVTSNIAFIYVAFSEQKLYRSLYLCRPDVTRMDTWTLCWVVGVTDFVVKFGVIVVKALVSLVPTCLISHRNKGAHYMLVEHVTQMYRCVLPVVPWFYFLFEEDDDVTSSPRWFSYFLLLLYVLFKCKHVLGKLREVRRVVNKFFSSDSKRGRLPTLEEMNQSENTCPICQDLFNDPVKLSCKHIFCSDCVSMWFDRERTCPMCRTVIVDKPVWRDGSTSVAVQIY